MVIDTQKRDMLIKILLTAILIPAASYIIGLALGIGGAYLIENLTNTFIINSGSTILLAF